MSEPKLVGVFDSERALLRAIKAARQRGYLIHDAHTPYAVHGLDEAMGLRPSRLPWVCFACGFAGAAFILWFQFWASAVDWPINVGGKPMNSLPAFVPITFEVMVLCAGLGTVAALLVRCGLLPGRAPKLANLGVTDDRFAVVIDAESAAFDRTEASALLNDCEATRVLDLGTEVEAQ